MSRTLAWGLLIAAGGLGLYWLLTRPAVVHSASAKAAVSPVRGFFGWVNAALGTVNEVAVGVSGTADAVNRTYNDVSDAADNVRDTVEGIF